MNEDTINCGRHPGAGWAHVGHGVQVRGDLADDLVHRLRAWGLALPLWSSFTGLTAARLRGWWLPPLPSALPLFVASGRAARIARPELHVCRHDTIPSWELVNGVRVCGAAETVLACARDLSLLDVVVIGDAALHAGDVSREELISIARLHRRGSPLLRRAIPLMTGQAESIYEGLLRMVHVVSGIEVVPQHVARTADGAFVARGDLLLAGTRTFHEYDGGHHRSPGQHEADLRRDRRLMEIGYHRRGYTSSDVLACAIGILRDADRTIGRVHDPSRIHAWYSLLQESLFTPSGQARLARRLGPVAENAEEPST